jgi:hypothetical protein
MDAQSIQRRLAKALRVANPTASVLVEGDRHIHVGLFTVEVGPDRVVIGPSGDKLTPEEIKLLADPDSVLWLVVMFNHEKFASKVVQFLKQHDISLPENWLA